ncbi:toxin-antitoxin system YwqK family antitoxin [Psychroflexus salinarum]|uniref:Toxin-antitoxin system YwqK family antitoxin n=1 Tax=Psychroflexus salinarum TaxID=546024 RepID=A0ABW3GNH5_9FLAO
MKALSTLLMVFLMSFTLFAQTENNLVKKEKVGDLEKVTIFYDSGELHQIGYILNDKLHGEWKSYDKEGNKLAKANYENGNKVGKWFFWNDGILSEVDYSNNRIVQVSTWDKLETQLVSN